MFELTLDQLTRIKLLACHPARPVACGEETHQVEFTCLQGFKFGCVVFVDFDDHAVKVVAATFDVQVTRPVVGVAHIGDVFAKPHRANFVGAAANGDVHHHLVKRFGLAVFHAPLAAEDGQAAHSQRQLAVGFVEAKTHCVVVQHVHTRHVLQHGFVRGGRKRPNEGVVGVFYIGGQHRAAVVKPCLGTQAEGGAQTIIGHRHIFGQQAVARAGFVQRPGQQAVEHKGRQVGRRAAFHGERVVFVESGCAQVADQAQLAAFGCVGVHVIEVGKTLRVLEPVPHGVAVGRP